MINIRKLTHLEAGSLTGNYHELDPMLLYPREAWDALAYHEKRWLQCRAAAMTSRGAVLIGRSAARALGIWVVGPADEVVELALPSGGTSPRRVARGGITYRRMRLRDDEITHYRGYPVTTPFRTFADIARHHGFVEGLIAADYLRHRGIDPIALEREVQRLGPINRIGTVRRCLYHAVPDSESPYESFARALLIEAGIGPITTQFLVDGYRADLLVENWLIIEIDGGIKYSGPDAEEVRQREFERQKRIANRGYQFLRFSPDFIRRNPDRFIAEVRAALDARGRIVAGG